MASAPKFITPEEAAYIELLLRDLDADSRKNGLQRLCALVRRGQSLLNPAPMRTVLVGLLNDESEKVRRWALNALALLGGTREATPILNALDGFRSSPDLLGAAISALSVLMPPSQFGRALTQNDLPLEGSVLFAAAQQNAKFIPLLRKGRINIDHAAPVDLRMATILVGLDKAPYRLFSPNHPNAAMIGELNTHDDPLVAQYSVWATVENPDFGLSHLRLPLREIESQPANVRGWIFRLLASDSQTATAHQDIIQTGSRDQAVGAREGLAEGLRDINFDGVDDIVVDWFIREESETVRQRLLEHMGRQADSFGRYGEALTSVYRQARHGSLMRARLETAARGTSLHRELKIIDLDAERADLFGSRDMTGSNTSAAKTEVEPAEPKLPDPHNVRVLIVVALPKELAAVFAAMSEHKRIGVAGDSNVYAVGTFANPEGAPRAVLVCQSGMGNGNAAVTATDALRSFKNVEHIIMCGIAGGCPKPDNKDEHVRLGDIVFSNEAGIIEYDFVKEEAGATTIRSYPQKPSNRMLSVANAIQAEDILGNRPWEAEIDAILDRSEKFKRPDDREDILHDADGTVVNHPPGSERDGRPRLHSGGIGTADTLQKSAARRDYLRDIYRVKAIEMEAGGMQNAAFARARSVMVVRGICDYCDANKNDAWQMYAAAAAAAFTKTLVLGVPPEWFPTPK